MTYGTYPKIGVGFAFTPTPYPLCTPNSTQGHPMSPKAGAPDTRGFRVVGVEG
jgi:hypothetical protein